MAIPRSVARAKSWVRKRRPGRVNALELQAAIKLLGGKRKFDIFTQQVRLEKKEKKARAKRKTKKVKKTPKKKGKSRKKKQPRKKYIPHALAITTGQKLPSTKSEAKHWIHARPPGRPPKKWKDRVVKLMGGPVKYQKYLDRVKQGKKGTCALCGGKPRKKKKKAKKETSTKDQKWRSFQMTQQIKRSTDQGYYVLTEPCDVIRSKNIIGEMLGNFADVLKKAQAYYQKQLDNRGWCDVPEGCRGLQVWGPGDSHEYIDPSALVSAHATIYELDELDNYKDPRFWAATADKLLQPIQQELLGVGLSMTIEEIKKTTMYQQMLEKTSEVMAGGMPEEWLIGKVKDAYKKAGMSSKTRKAKTKRVIIVVDGDLRKKYLYTPTKSELEEVTDISALKESSTEVSKPTLELEEDDEYDWEDV